MASAAVDRYRKTLDSVQDAIAKAHSLLAAGTSATARETLTAAQEKLSRVPKKYRGDLADALDTLLEQANQAPAHRGPADVMPDYEDVVKEAGGYIRQGVEGLLRTADAATKLAHIMLSGYERFRHNDAPDFMALSQNSRDFASAVQQETARQYKEANPDVDWEDVQLMVNRVWRVYKNRIGDLRARMCLEFDNNPAEFKRRFPQAAEQFPDLKPSEAMSFYYHVDLLGPSERDRLSKRLKSLKEKHASTPAGPERDSISAQIKELEDVLGKARVPAQSLDIVKTTRKAVRQVGEAVLQVNPAEARKLPASEKRILAQTLPTSIQRLTALLAAVTETDEAA